MLKYFLSLMKIYTMLQFSRNIGIFLCVLVWNGGHNCGGHQKHKTKHYFCIIWKKKWNCCIPSVCVYTICPVSILIFAFYDSIHVQKHHLACFHFAKYTTVLVCPKYFVFVFNFIYFYCSFCLKGHWTTSASSPIFFQKSWDFYIIRSVYLCSDCMLNLTCSFNSVTKIYAFFFQ